MTATEYALIGFLTWTLALLVLMECIRTKLVIKGEVEANGFTPDNANLSDFMQRLARAHANCLEGLALFGGIMLVALISGKTELTDPLAWYFLAARIAQSSVHLASLSALAVRIRFSFFAVQMLIGIYWLSLLLQS